LTIMNSVTKADVARPAIRWDLSDPKLFDGGIPHGAFAALRALDGLAWNAIDGSPTDGFWAVGRLDDVAVVSRDPRLFSSARGHIQIYSIDDDALSARASMIDMDPPDHTRLRRLVCGIPNADRATVRQLLDHTSGVPSWEFDTEWIRHGRGSAMDPSHLATRRTILKSCSKTHASLL
jgi:cytochrome P450